jgi:antitoxin VapB
MGLSIKHDEVERMIRQLASKQQSSMVQAIGVAVRRELEREGLTPLTDEEMARRVAAVRALQDKIARDGIDRSRSEDEILGYDRDGITEQPHSL